MVPTIIPAPRVSVPVPPRPARGHHRLPRDQPHPEVMQGTTACHHQSANTLFPPGQQGEAMQPPSWSSRAWVWAFTPLGGTNTDRKEQSMMRRYWQIGMALVALAAL